MLRAECNFLRIEREFALKSVEKNRVKMERILRSTVRTLVSGKDKFFEGKNVKAVLEEEIKDIEEKIEELKKSSRIKDYEVRKCSNFDKRACLLRNRLEKLGGLAEESCVKELLEVSESSSNIKGNGDLNLQTKNKFIDMDELRKKMEGLSKGMLDATEEEYMSMFTGTANSSVASSASTSKRIDLCPEFSSASSRQVYQEPNLKDENRCSGRCKAIIHRILEQVRAETEQWSQMQEMLGQVRGEMEELRMSRDFWENLALSSDQEIQSLIQSAEEWKEKAISFENKANDLQLELFTIKEELQEREAVLIPLGRQLENEKQVLSCHLIENCCFHEKGNCFENAINELNVEQSKEQTQNKDLPPLSLVKHLAKEHCSKETHHSGYHESKPKLLSDERRKAYTDGNGVLPSKRLPLQDIGNASNLLRQVAQHTKAVLSSQDPEQFRMRK